MTDEHNIKKDSIGLATCDGASITTFCADTTIINAKLNIGSIDTSNAISGQVLTVNHDGDAVWAEPEFGSADKKLREKYPGLKTSWENVMEAIEEYEMVKKLVIDHD